MALKVYDTATRGIVPFEPLEEGKARVYACGPTIYDHAHIGNFRTFLFFDLVHRYLEWSGYDVTFVMNLTDVDDKTIAGALDADTTVADFTRPFGEVFLEDSRTLGIRPVDRYPRATEYIQPMVSFIDRLVASGHAYHADDGAVYFSIGSFPSYGKLKGIDPGSLRVGARVDHDEYEKDDARDFALWKVATEGDERAAAAWDSPWGRGRPGWHLECSVMSTSELGDTLDMHLGGEDLVFPHHENEIAQSEAATGKPFVRHWLHVKHLQVEGRKMSKSLGNFVTVHQLLEEGHDPASIRHLLLSAHYRSDLNFTREGLGASASAIQRLVDFTDRVASGPLVDGEMRGPVSEATEQALSSFRDALDDDFNTPDGLAALFTLVNRVNAEIERAGGLTDGERSEVGEAIDSMDHVLGLLEVARASRVVEDDVAAWVESKIADRAAARSARDFQAADAIRDELADRGIILEDGADGTRWKVVG